MVEWENDKPTVVALREIAEGYVTESILEEREQQSLDDLLDLEQAPSALTAEPPMPPPIPLED
jgi:hypothetical protein